MTGFITFCINDAYEHFQVPLNKDGTKIDFRKVFGKLDFYSHCYDPYFKDVVIYYESVHSVFNSSAKSNFNFGGAVWSLEAIFVCTLAEPTLVQPKAWQKEMHKGIEKNDDKKAMSLQAAQKLFPEMTFKRTERCTTPDHNLIDSLLICEYGKRKYYENNSQKRHT
jgi:hypothetical protein